jgi:tetratricopeptide (TPR) repeat protein
LEGEGPTPKQGQEKTVFISYAREDFDAAKELYKDLKNAGLTPWLDKESLLPGEEWDFEIRKAIKKSTFFLVVLSSNSVDKRGYVQKEFKFGLEVLDEVPESQIFVIPVRLNECNVPYEKLRKYHYVDLFPDWEEGVRRILQSTGVSAIYEYVKIQPKISPPFRGEKRIFVDREEYIHKTIKEYLKPSSRVSIIGPGGSGKSQLAFKAIHEYEKAGLFNLVIPIYLDAGMITFDQFLLRIADKLGIPQNQFEKYDIDERKNTITNALSGKNNPLILVDNFETILYAIPSSVTDYDKEYNDSTDTATSLPSSEDNAIQIKYYLNNNIPDNTSILVTSRERFNLDEEKKIDLEGLREDDSNRLFERLAKNEQLKEVSSEQIRRKINEMIKKIGGHPLSIEVLAKNVRSIKQVEQVSEILGNYINKDEPNKRLQSLQGSLGFTINNLDDKLRQLLSNLILFKSPFPVYASTEIFGAEEEDILNLYERTLLTRIESDDVYGQIEIPEYWLYKLHPAIRNYFESKKTENLEQEYGEAFSRYYWNFLSDTYNEWGKENHLSSMARFNIIAESEYNDFDRAIELTNTRQVGAGISKTLGLIFTNLGILSKALEYHNRSLGIDEQLNDITGLAADYAHIGLVLGDLGKLQEALDSHNKALKIHVELNDRVGMAKDYMNIGIVLGDLGKLQEALDSHNKAVKIHVELNDRVEMAKDYMNIGNVLGDLGKLQEALDSHNKALKIHVELNDRVLLAADHANIGIVLRIMGMYQEALDSYNKALKIQEELNDRVAMGRDYTNIGLVLGHMGKLQEALDSHNKALKIQEELNDRVGLARNYWGIANVLVDLDNYQEALDSYNKALKIHEELNDRVAMGADHTNIGGVFLNLDNYQEALDSYNKALKIHEELNDRVETATDYYNISILLSETNKNEALKSIYNALTILQIFEKENNYRHPLMEKVNSWISRLEG